MEKERLTPKMLGRFNSLEELKNNTSPSNGDIAITYKEKTFVPSVYVYHDEWLEVFAGESKVMIICVGNSGSGKTTWAKQYVKENNSFLRINMDDIRESMFCKTKEEYWNKEETSRYEYLVHQIYYSNIKVLLEQGKGVVIDGTNLTEKAIDKLIEIAKDCGVDFRFKIFDVPLETCLHRIFPRDRFHLNTEYTDTFDSLLKKQISLIKEKYPEKILDE